MKTYLFALFLLQPMHGLLATITIYLPFNQNAFHVILYGFRTQISFSDKHRFLKPVLQICAQISSLSLFLRRLWLPPFSKHGPLSCSRSLSFCPRSLISPSLFLLELLCAEEDSGVTHLPSPGFGQGEDWITSKMESAPVSRSDGGGGQEGPLPPRSLPTSLSFHRTLGPLPETSVR